MEIFVAQRLSSTCPHSTLGGAADNSSTAKVDTPGQYLITRLSRRRLVSSIYHNRKATEAATANSVPTAALGRAPEPDSTVKPGDPPFWPDPVEFTPFLVPTTHCVTIS